MEIFKVDTVTNEKFFKKIEATIKKFELAIEHSKNEMKSLENWVEKYLPLRL